jgi:hypothetical protein
VAKEIDVTVGYVVDDGNIEIDSVNYTRPATEQDAMPATYCFDWMVDDGDFNVLLVGLVEEYEADVAEGYRDSEAEAKMEELRERRLDSAA